VATEEIMDIEVITEMIEAGEEVEVGEMTVEIELENWTAITVEIEMIEDQHILEMNLVESDGAASHTTTEPEGYLHHRAELVRQHMHQEIIEMPPQISR
jgi:hypothetical protein